MKDMLSNKRADFFSEKIQSGIDLFIPQRSIMLSSSSQPWFNNACLALVASKNAAWGTSTYPDAARLCSIGLADAYNNYIKKPRDKLRQLPRGSKRWWKLTNSLLGKPTRSGGSIPALRNHHVNGFLLLN